MSRISEDRMERALEQLKTISKEDYAKGKALAAIVKPLRSVLHKTPDEGTTRRFKDGYNYLGRYPEKVIAFFDKHMN